jgi:hypothetical protein
LVAVPYVSVKGRGNSEADSLSKLHQLMATLCSAAKWYRDLAVFVLSRDDQASVTEFAETHLPHLLRRLRVVRFVGGADNNSSPLPPGSLPFLALTWVQRQLALGGDTKLKLQPLPRTVQTPREEESLPQYSYVYFTEADQVLRIQDADTLALIRALSNESALVLPRRREKSSYSPAHRYMHGLGEGRSCGRLIETDNITIALTTTGLKTY